MTPAVGRPQVVACAEVRGPSLRRFVIALALVASVTAAACTNAERPRTGGGIYLSLGDSVAAGNGASDKAATSFVSLIARDEGNLETLNIAVAGSTTTDVIEKQLPQALAQTADARLDFITISVGGNDLAGLIPNATCQHDPLPATCPLDSALAKIEANLGTILDRLRDAHPETPIVLLAYPNFFSGTGHPFEAPAARVLPRLNDVIRRVAAKYAHAAIAEAAPPFEGRGRELTHVLDRAFDPHPTDAGHRLIADAFIAALTRIR